MPQLTVISHGKGAAVVLPQAVLDSVGLQIGDTVDVTVEDRALIFRSIVDAERHRLMDQLTQEVLDQRSDAYQRLA